MLRKVIPLIFMLVCFSAIAEDKKSQQQLEEFLASTNTLSAHFQQKLVDEYGMLLQQSTGTLNMQRPGKFRWDYILPYPQSIISNGKKLWMYDSELEQANVRPYDQMLSSSPVNLLDKNQKLDEEFIVYSLPFEKDQHWIKLLPKNKESDFKEMLIGMHNGKIKTMHFLDNFNQRTEIDFEKMTTNVNFTAKQFEFSAPQGTDIIGDF